MIRLSKGLFVLKDPVFTATALVFAALISAAMALVWDLAKQAQSPVGQTGAAGCARRPAPAGSWLHAALDGSSITHTGCCSSLDVCCHRAQLVACRCPTSAFWTWAQMRVPARGCWPQRWASCQRSTALCLLPLPPARCAGSVCCMPALAAEASDGHTPGLCARPGGDPPLRCI